MSFFDDQGNFEKALWINSVEYEIHKANQRHAFFENVKTALAIAALVAFVGFLVFASVVVAGGSY